MSRIASITVNKSLVRAPIHTIGIWENGVHKMATFAFAGWVDGVRLKYIRREDLA